MADWPSSRVEPKALAEDTEEDYDLRSSNSTSRRHDHYEQQRIGRRSRPSSGESQLRPSTSKSRGKRASYQEPFDYQNLNEIAAPGAARRNDPYSLEQAQNTAPARMASKREPKALGSRDDLRRRFSGKQTDVKDQGLSGTAAPPPVQQSSQEQRLMDDADGDDADAESLSAPAPYVQRRPQEYIAGTRSRTPPSAVPRWLTEIYTISYLIFFSILGTLARLGMQWLTFYPGAPIVTPVIWANFGGSLLMGFLAEDQGLFRDHWASSTTTEKRTSDHTDRSDLEKLNKAERAKTKKTIPLYIGLATGFCGSFTSFSSFARDAFLALSNDLPTPIDHPSTLNSAALSTTSTTTRNSGYSFEAWTAVVITTLALSLSALIVGAHLALFLHPYTPRISLRLTQRVLDPLILPLGLGSWLGAILLAIFPPASHTIWRGEVLFALVFAPLGCILRFYASLKLNPLAPAFPLGTFAVNMLGTAVEGMCYDVQHVGVGVMGRVGGGVVGCQVLQGVMDGFCGCLTTVSTWVAEIEGLRRKHGYVYALASVLGALCLMVVIMGSVRWSVGWSAVACDTGYTSKIYG